MSEELDNKKRRINWTPEKVMSTSAIVISVISLVAMFYQLSLAREENELIRKQQSASVLPHLRFSPSSSPQHIEYAFINKGVGPAFVTKVEFTIQDSIFHRSDFFVNHIQDQIYKSEATSISASTYSFMEGDVLSANDELAIFTIRGEAGVKLFSDYLNSIEWGYVVIYEDVYGAGWRLSSENDFPVSIPDE